MIKTNDPSNTGHDPSVRPGAADSTDSTDSSLATPLGTGPSTSSAGQQQVPRSTLRRAEYRTFSNGRIAVDVAADQSTPHQRQDDRAAERSHAEQLLKLAEASGDFFHTASGQAFGTMAVGDHHETYPVDSADFNRWLRGAFYAVHRTPPSQEAIHSTRATLEARAQIDGPECEVFMRVGASPAAIWIDLGDPTWKAVKIDAHGWEVTVPPSAIRFRRMRGMDALPIPLSGGSIDQLRPFLNLPSEDEWVLTIGVLLMMYHPKGPYPMYESTGEPGSGKTTNTRVLRRLVDPSTVLDRSAPSDERDLMIAAQNGWVLAFDNMSIIRPWLSDAFCRLATGGGFGKRQLYSDADEVLIDVRRPILLNGINPLVTRGDLLSRTIAVNPPTIPGSQRQSEEAFWNAFTGAQPYILGAIFDTLSVAVRNRPETTLDRLPRLADLVLWVTAAEPALGWATGTFQRAYEAHQQVLSERAVDADVVGPMLICMVEEGGGAWNGTATQLLQRLRHMAQDDWIGLKHLPNSAAALGNKLHHLMPDFRRMGIEVTFTREGRSSNRLIHLRKLDEPAVGTVGTVGKVKEVA